jgi:hypothetical protein
MELRGERFPTAEIWRKTGVKQGVKTENLRLKLLCKKRIAQKSARIMARSSTFKAYRNPQAARGRRI